MESVPCKSEDQKIHGILNDFLQRKERAGSSASQISEALGSFIMAHIIWPIIMIVYVMGLEQDF